MERILCFVLSSVLCTVAYSASFDCVKATGFVEQTICENSWLGRLDEEMAEYYTMLRTSLDEEGKRALLEKQRAWLKSRETDCRNAYNKKACLGDMYGKWVVALKIRHDTPLLPTQSELNGVCGDLAALSPDNRQKYGSDDNIDDINNDGIREISKSCWGGTMNTPCIDYFLPDGSPLRIDTINFEWKTYWTYGLRHFSKDGRVFRLHSYDDYFQKPAYLSYVTPTNNEYVVCEFKNVETDVFQPIASTENAAEVCAAVRSADTSKLSQIRLNDSPTLSGVELRNMGRYETTLIGQGWLDYDNDGNKDHVGELGYASGAGRGCNFNYFDELNDTGTAFVQSQQRNILLEMQNVGLESRHPNCGGSVNGQYTNRFFEFEGVNYYEYRTRTNRKVSVFIDGEIKDICTVKKLISTSVSSIRSSN